MDILVKYVFELKRTCPNDWWKKVLPALLSLKVLGDLSSRHLMLDNFKYRSIRSFLFSLSRQSVTVIARQLVSTTTKKCLQGHLGTSGGGGLQELTNLRGTVRAQSHSIG